MTNLEQKKQEILAKLQEDMEEYLYADDAFDLDLRLSVTLDTVSESLDTYAQEVRAEVEGRLEEAKEDLVVLQVKSGTDKEAAIYGRVLSVLDDLTPKKEEVK